MLEEQTKSRKGARWLLALGVVAVLYAGYRGVMAVVRAHVDSRIEENVGSSLPDFRLPTAVGGELTSQDLSGHKVLLNFFRSHCVNCDAEAPVIRQLAADLPDNAMLIGVMTDKVMGFDPDVTAETLERKAFRHPVVMADEAFLDEFHGQGWARITPVSYLVDSNGRIVEALRGRQTLETLRSALAKLD